VQLRGLRRHRACRSGPWGTCRRTWQRVKAVSFAQTQGYLLYDLGSDDLTRAAPCREAVKHHECLLLAERLVECRLAVIALRQSAPKTHDVVHLMRDTTGMGDSRLEVVYAPLFLAHLGCVVEELLGEEWAVEVCRRCGVDRSCLKARRCEQCSGSFER
jgi:hypothetical protein